MAALGITTTIMSPRFLLLSLFPFLSLLAYDVRGQTGGLSPEERVAKMERVTSQLMRQLMLQQLYVEEMSRSSGDSGIKQIRRRMDGPKPYYTGTYTSRSVAAIHDHTDHVATCGMGEFIGVLNGVEFRTRHNDYKLKMPSPSSGDYHATEDIPYPDVPPEVLQHTTVDGQIKEMREWFKAWKTSNTTLRDYRKYFKPNLCYLEGAWTTDETLEEPFDSDRHQLEAASWFELQEQVRFTSYTGDKNHKENFAYLPTTITNITDGIPVFGQWNYRILCHPLKGVDLKLSQFKPIDNLANRVVTRDSFEDFATTSRSARFRLEPESGSDGSYRWSLLDDLMYQIPGKDNYRANLNESLFGLQKITANTEKPLNSGYYHRVYKVVEKDAMGEKYIFKGFADRNLFVAETTQPRVAAMSIPFCKSRWDRRRGKCENVKQRVSYAIPLEIVYTTPLQSWNPYRIEYKGDVRSKLGKTVNAGGQRNGRVSVDKAFNGTHNKAYYLTPSQFFNGREVGKGAADTSRGSVGVLDPAGELHAVRSSGIRIFLPSIPDVGVLRTRWPIMPISAEGSPIWKELEALRDVVMDMKKYFQYFPTTPPFPAEVLKSMERKKVKVHKVLATSLSLPDPLGLHAHTIDLTRKEFWQMRARNQTLSLDTSEDNGHSHRVLVRFDRKLKKFVMIQCDSVPVCFDGHSNVLEQEATKTNYPIS